MLTHFIGQKEIRSHILQDMVAATQNDCCICSKHMLLHMNEGSGRTTLLRYMTEVYEENHVRNFMNLDLFIEEILPSTLKELNLLERRIVSKAVFANHFSGIIALDAAALEKCLNDSEYMATFRRMVFNLREHAMMIFFMPEQSSARANRVEQILEELCEHYVVNLPARMYSVQDLTSILDILLRDNGICPGDRRYPENAERYIIEHAEELTPYTLKCLVRNIKYDALYLNPEERIVL